MPEPETLTQVKQKPEVREALAQTGGKPRIKAQTRDKFWFTTHVLVLLACAAVWLALGWKWIPLPQPHLDLLARAIRATVFIVVVLAIAKAISVYAIGRIEDASTTFTLRRILHRSEEQRLNSSHMSISYAVFCLKKKKTNDRT